MEHWTHIRNWALEVVEGEGDNSGVDGRDKEEDNMAAS